MTWQDWVLVVLLADRLLAVARFLNVGSGLRQLLTTLLKPDLL